MKRMIAFLIFSGSVQAKAQQDIKGLVNAEKSFAAYAVTHNVKAAFLQYLDSTGIVFEKGQPLNGLASWNQKQTGPGILNWYPQFAEIAASGDWGYTTGPWTFQPRTMNDSVVARGQYTTVWHLDNQGDWKFLVDLGVSRLPSTDSAAVTEVHAGKVSTHPIDLASMIKAEETFINQYKKSRDAAYHRFLSLQSMINRNGQLPAITLPEQSSTIEATPANISFSINGSGIAKSGDLGYVYGTTVLNEKKENYLHIWRREKEGWKIALEVMRYQ
jgi:ketosteroid isomerase-like protein